MNTSASTTPPISTFAPLRERTFAILWTATVLGNVATFMRDATNTWMVTELSRDPAAVALVQAMATLPIFLFSLPAGVLADLVDRRRLVIVAQLMLAAVAVALWTLSAFHALSLSNLALLSFLGGTGAALMVPAWQAVTPDLVPAAERRSAVTLGSLGVNLARATGPAIGGLVLALFGAAAVYAVGIASYVVVIAALLWWRSPPVVRDDLAEALLGAFRAGLRFMRASRDLHSVLLRAVLVFALSSCLWALLPLVSREVLGGGPTYYGLLLGAIGGGAIAGAVVLPRLRQRWSNDQLIQLSTLVSSAVLLALAAAPPQALAALLLMLFGVAWITTLTTLGGLAQAVLPNWVRARGLSIYLTAFSGAMALGSVAWGVVAQATRLSVAMVIGGVALAMCGLGFGARSLPKGESDLQPSNHWPEPAVAADIDGDRGPVLVQIEYRVPLAVRPAFLALLNRLADARRRDGAYQWGIVEDAAEPERVIEWFFVESWSEHLRQHRRVSVADADLQREAVAFHAGEAPPVVRHLLAVNRASGDLPLPNESRGPPT